MGSRRKKRKEFGWSVPILVVRSHTKTTIKKFHGKWEAGIPCTSMGRGVWNSFFDTSTRVSILGGKSLGRGF